jgi:hypothetical protein
LRSGEGAPAVLTKERCQITLILAAGAAVFVLVAAVAVAIFLFGRRGGDK